VTVVAVALALAAGGAAADAVGAFRASGTGTAAGGSSSQVSLATVVRQALASRTSVNATLGYAGSYTVTGKGSGTLTWLPGSGDVVREGGVLYRSTTAPRCSCSTGRSRRGDR
jgi:hypothetical protein